MPRVIILTALLLLLLMQFYACSDQDEPLTHESIVIADSCLNIDTLQITAQGFDQLIDLEETQLGSAWIARAGNRTMLLQYSKRKRKHGDVHWGGSWNYYHHILGVFVGREPLEEGEEFTFYFIRLKDNKELRQVIPAALKKDHPDLKFEW